MGIGASAGGLEALELFFRNMPENTGMAFVVVQHLDPDHKGILPELLQRATGMKVLKVTGNMKAEPDHVYVIPPNKSLTIDRGRFQLSEPVESRGLRLPIDIFFRSLAEERQERSIGIILSGMGSDGSSGVKAIKEKGGLIAIQDPETAKFDAMPRNAMHSVVCDIVAPPEELPYRIISYLKISPPVRVGNVNDIRIKNNIDKILFLLRQHTGHDFSCYKKSGIYRRIERRKGVHQIEKIQDYVKFLSENPKEIDILFKELMIGVTSFFRDLHLWEKLRDEVLQEMMEDMPDGYSIRVWIPGCSTGEEAYSWAMILREAQEKLKKPKNISIQIFATDIDRDAIEKARKGVYSGNITVDVTQERIAKFFTHDVEGYRVSASLREVVVFAEQNVVRDPPFTRIDILSCRNLFIYLEAERQKKLISLFYYSLKPGGLFVLGNAETLINHRDRFEEIDSKLKIYRRSASAFSVYTDLIDFPSSIHPLKNNATINKKMPAKEPDNIQIVADQHVIQNFAPPTVLVNEKGDIVYITGRTGKYLEPPAGKANWNIYSMARSGLRHELPGVFRLALKSYEPVVVPDVKIGTNGGEHHAEVIVQRIKNPASIRNMIIVVFRDLPVQARIEKDSVGSSRKSQQYKEQQYKEIEKELEKSYEDLQSTREEMQASQEELKSINEELQSTNEELQSTNEELTTSKEEMQSMNEELQTLNAELQSKVNDLVQANNDMKNLLNNTEIATLFLDKDLSIRRFTDPVKRIFKLRNADIGRPFTDLVTNLQYPELETHARRVLKTLTMIDHAATTVAGLCFNVRIVPYRTEDDRIDGLVMTFTDITKTREMEMELEKAKDELRKLRS